MHLWERIFKKVAEYDLMKLFVEYRFILKVICQVTFKTYPSPYTSGILGITVDKTITHKINQTLLELGLFIVPVEVGKTSVVQELGIGKEIEFNSLS